jgi:hypothetical protein
MRTVTANMTSKLIQKLGTEPLLIVEVEWVEGSFLQYCDRKINGAAYPYPKVLNVGGFDSSMKLSGASDSQEISITLDDTDGSIKTIYNQTDIHKRPASVYLVYDSPSDFNITTDRVLLFTGEIVTPFQWGEGDRSVTFTILSKLEDAEVSFSMEEGNFPNIPDEALGQAWPLVFGEVCNIPAVQVRAPRRGYLLHGTGIHDFTIHDRLAQAHLIQCPVTDAGTQISMERTPTGIVQTDAQIYVPEKSCVVRRAREICKLDNLLSQQMAYETSTINIYNGVSFPQAQTITLHVNGAKFTGSFSGNIFTITNRIHPDFDEIGIQTVTDVGNRHYTAIYSAPTTNWVPAGGAATFANATHARYNGTLENSLNECGKVEPRMSSAGGPAESWEAYSSLKAANFFWAAAGTEVFVESEAEILFIVSLLPGTVDRVCAYRTLTDGSKLLMEVPPEYYTVYETDYVGYQVVEIGLEKKLSIREDNWDDQLFVSFTSSVGPNPVDIIEYLVEKYTDLTINTASFDSVKTYMTKYPCNFYLLDRKSVYQVIQDIAYQSRCQVFIRNKEIFIVYLSLEPSSVRTLSEDDILLNSFKESLSDTSDIYTTHKITYQKGGARLHENDSIDFKLFLKYNVKKYGTRILEDDFYAYNIGEVVLKSATFWLIRKANVWKKVEFEVPMRHIDLDVTDCISLDITQFSETPVKCIIENMQFDPDTNTIKMLCWTPIRTGETTPFYWAWPSQQNALTKWPLPGDVNGGAGYDFQVTPPIGHILTGGQDNEDQLELITGDQHPSDLDDTTPTLFCEFSDTFDPTDIDPEFIDFLDPQELANEALQSEMENLMTEGPSLGAKETGFNAKTKEPAKLCGHSIYGGCAYGVIRRFHMSISQREADESGASCLCKGAEMTCVGPIWQYCHTFGTKWAAEMMFQQAQANGKPYPAGHWDCNETAEIQPYGQIISTETEDPITGVPCDSYGIGEGIGSEVNGPVTAGEVPDDWPGPG